MIAPLSTRATRIQQVRISRRWAPQFRRPNSGLWSRPSGAWSSEQQHPSEPRNLYERDQYENDKNGARRDDFNYLHRSPAVRGHRRCWFRCSPSCCRPRRDPPARCRLAKKLGIYNAHGVLPRSRIADGKAGDDGGVQRTPSARQISKSSTARCQKMNKELLP